jgi:hypothetical protein
MNTPTKLFLFYLSLNDFEKQEFTNLVGINNLNKIKSRADLISIMDSINQTSHPDKKISSDDYDIAIMQVVKHIVNASDSNLDLSKSIEDIIGKSVSRPEKRAKYELQGMLLAALMNASKDKLARIRNQFIHRIPKNTADERNRSNLDKWFSIILGTRK